MENNEQYSNLNIPDFETLYKSEAKRLLKSINEQMEFYYKRSVLNNVDALELYQIVQKINKFESSVPGLDILKRELSNDILALIAYIEKKFSAKRKNRMRKILSMQDEISKLTKQRDFYLALVLCLQIYLFPKFRALYDKIVILKYEVAKLENEESCEKRASLNTKQLIKISHIFREKYLNIPVPQEYVTQTVFDGEKH